MPKNVLRERIDNACLSDENLKIAELALLKDMDLADIAPHVHFDRSTVGRRYHSIIKIL